MSTAPTASASTSRPNFHSIFTSAFQAYKKKTGKDITSHPLATELQSCNSIDTILAVLQGLVPARRETQNSDEGTAKCQWIVPTVNVLYAFSATLAEGVGLAFSPAKVIFTGIGILLLAVKDVSTSQELLPDLFNRIGNFFLRLEIYTGVRPTTAMTDIIVQIMVEVLTILGSATKGMKHGRLKTYLKKLMGDSDVEDGLKRLDKLTQEEALMASAELLKMADRLGSQVVGVDDRVRGVDSRVREVGDNVGNQVQDVDGRVQGIGKDIANKVEDVGAKVQGVDGKVQHVDDKVQDVSSMVQGVGEEVQDVGDRVHGIDHRLDQAARNQLRDRLLQWLAPPDPSTNHNIACKASHSGTAKWFFQGTIFNQWKSTGPFLWIHGKPGSGKSILCSSIIQDILVLREAGRASMAYFYFDFRDIGKQKLQHLLHSLLIQLSAQSTSCCDILFRLYSVYDRGVRTPGDRAMVECLKEMLTLEEAGPTYLVLDALDECPNASGVPSPREEVLDFVKELVNLHLPNLHICVTSRPEFDIREVLQPLSPCAVSLHDESGQMVDIIEYVTSIVYTDRSIRRWRQEDKDIVIKTLSERANGMFRWVFCQLEVLRHCFPPSVRHVLEELPESLDETYERILKEIRKPNQKHTHRLLQCLVVAVRPLRIAELAEVLAVNFEEEGIPKLNPDWRWADEERAIMSACSSLVTIVDGDDGSRVAQFSHFSVKEYLMSDRLAEASRDVSRYHIPLEPAHTILAQACLGVLLQLDNGVDLDSIKNFPLAEYAAEYWVTHAQFKNVSSRISDGMECLFDANKPHFAAWVWVYDHDHNPMNTFRPEKPNADPLYYAARLGFRGLAEHLFTEHPTRPDPKGGAYETPLHAALAKGHGRVSWLLIEHGANVTFRCVDGRTPIYAASIGGLAEIVRWLLKHGGNVNVRTGFDRTPLYAAAARGHPEIVRILLEHEAKVNTQDVAGDTPLHYASSGGDPEIVRLLLEHGAKVDLCNEMGRRAIQEASGPRRQEIVQLLSDYGAESAE